MTKDVSKKKKAKLATRPPIVSVLGHVDHGKTTLLDKIRKSRVQEREAGGITQGIGASQIETKDGKKITFIDTPGHSAFAKMRSRGANLSDISLLVIAANDGVKPQTKEALRFIEESGSPFLVVATKIDLPSASIEKVKKDLKESGVKVEEEGGDVPVVSVSAKSGEGIDELLEMIILMSEVVGIEAKEEDDLEAVIVETNKDKRGMLVSVILKNGTLKIADEIYADGIRAKVRGLFDHTNKPVKKVGPGDPVLILGFSELPSVGEKLVEFGKQDKEIRETTNQKRSIDLDEGKIPIAVKAESQGSLEAVLENIPEKFSVIHSGVGDVKDSDIFLAKNAKPARIFVFKAKVPKDVSRLADTESVEVEQYEIIYKMLEKLEEIEKEGKEEILGEAIILEKFPFNKKIVAGSKITKGQIKMGDKLHLYQEDEHIGNVRVTSMRKLKDKIKIAKEGEELGIIFSPQLDFSVGNVLKSIR